MSVVIPKRERVTVDASGQTLGRLSSQIAILLRGKHKPTYIPYLECGDDVHVVNLRNARFTGRKLTTHVRYRFSGYPGGLRADVLRDRWQRNPERVVREMVHSMLPPNRLRVRMIKHLTVEW